MKLKNIIKPKMIIHCTSFSQIKVLMAYLESFGYEWSSGNSLVDSTFLFEDDDNVYFWLEEDKTVTWSENGVTIEDYEYKVIEFDDLIDNSEISAYEFLDWLRDGYIRGCAGIDNRLRTVFHTISLEDIITKYTTKEILAKYLEYKSGD